MANIVFPKKHCIPQPMVVPSAALHHASISASSTQVVSEVLSKMVMVGITDPGTATHLYCNNMYNFSQYDACLDTTVTI